MLLRMRIGLQAEVWSINRWTARVVGFRQLARRPWAHRQWSVRRPTERRCPAPDCCATLTASWSPARRLHPSGFWLGFRSRPVVFDWAGLGLSLATTRLEERVARAAEDDSSFLQGRRHCRRWGPELIGDS